MIELARLITRTRKAKHLTQKVLAERAGVHPNSIYLMEAGADSRVSTLLKICAVLDLTITTSADGSR